MPISLAQLIREARLRHGPMVQRDLAELVGTSLENITSIENGRNRQPKPEIVTGLARALDLRIEDIWAAMSGMLNHYPWEKVGDLDLQDPELELMFKQVDNLLTEEARDQVKAFIRFTLEQERKRSAQKKKNPTDGRISKSNP